jgi:AcrR family transcriptional regulator
VSAARDRLLQTATRLFYAEGVRTVGVDRVIAEAGVAKATFYHHFPSKDDLVVAYLAGEWERQRALMENLPTAGVERIRAIFTEFAEVSCGPGFRGCLFLNAAAEFHDPAHPARRVVDGYRTWFRALMRDLLTADARDDADRKADFLLLARDGIAVGGGLGDEAAVRAGVTAALGTL